MPEPPEPPEPPNVRPSFALIPRGPALSEDGMQRLAGSAGQLVGAIVDGAVCTWLAKRDGELELLMWPRDFRAHFEPLELLDADGEVLARGGDVITVVGSYLPHGDPRSLGHERVFAAWKVSLKPPAAP